MYDEIAQGRETISLGGGREVATRAYVASLNLRGQMQEKLVGALSGGERGRVHLAKTLLDGCNLLILDEPSNDLDVDTLRSLEEARCTDPHGPHRLRPTHTNVLPPRHCTTSRVQRSSSRTTVGSSTACARTRSPSSRTASSSSRAA